MRSARKWRAETCICHTRRRRPWVDGLIEECAAFPNGAHDDQVDALTQALNRMRSGSGVFGVLKYLKQLSATGGADAVERKPANSEKVPNGGAYPACGSTAIARVFGSWRCNQCGWQPPASQDVIPNAPLRRMTEKARSRW
ncbi:MAG TPA: hypothetical protein VEU11_17605 [Terriglobales bacterium]|nr:hypothetical protein [Terriglobales bacterium]